MNLKITFFDKDKKEPGDFINIKISYDEAEEISKSVSDNYMKEKFNCITDEDGNVHDVDIEDVYSFEIQK